MDVQMCDFSRETQLVASIDGIDPQSDSSQRWLALLFIETFLLFILQVVLGVFAGSLVLLADSGHAAVDVLSYAFSFCVERMKSRVASDVGLCGYQVHLRSADAIGSCISLCALVIATCFVVLRAAQVLSEANHETSAEYNLLGSVLLVFSLLSTICNIAVAVMYRGWSGCSESRLGFRHTAVVQSSLSEDQRHAHDNGHVSTNKHNDVPGQDFSYHSSDEHECHSHTCHGKGRYATIEPPPMIAIMNSAKSASSRRNARPLLNLRGDFAGCRVATGDSQDSTCSGHCHGRDYEKQDANEVAIQEHYHGKSMEHDSGQIRTCGRSRGAIVCLRNGDLQFGSIRIGTSGQRMTDESSSQSLEHGHRHSHNHGSGHCNGHGDVLLSNLHSIVHPGCNHCSSGITADSEQNLNVNAALLHLMSDILRGILIFIVAILVEVHAVPNAKVADAVCALVVSGFILIGSLALFNKVYVVFYGGPKCETIPIA